MMRELPSQQVKNVSLKGSNLYFQYNLLFHPKVLVRSGVGCSSEDNIQYASLKKSIII